MSDILTFTNDSTPEDDEFDPPNGSKWIVAVDNCGLVSILHRPYIHYSFFDNGEGAEEIGLPFEVSDTNPGVYEWVCDFVTSRCYESGHIDNWEFEVRTETCLYSLPDDQPLPS